MLELTLLVGADRVEEVLDAILPRLPGGLHLREVGEQVELAILATEGTPDEEELRALAGASLVELRAREVSADWRERRLARYEPLVVAARFLLRPEWAPPGEDPALIEIALTQTGSFGTGMHPTTQACLASLAELDARGSLADIGCGSGVLSIAAAKLGFSPVIAVDIEPTSVATACGNAARNGVELDARRIDVATEPPPPADTVLANLPPAVHAGLARHLRRAPVTLIASGFKPEKIPAVASAWEEHGLQVADEVRASEWAALVMR